MATLTIPFVHVAGTLAKADDVNANMNAIKTFLNSFMIQVDGSIPFTGTPSGPATMPVSANQYTRKQYVDNRIQAGGTSIGFVSESVKTITVTFPASYSSAPHVVACARSTIFSSIVSVTGITTTSFQVRCEIDAGNALTGTVGIEWIAVGAPA